jgi:hypothetical protein
MPGNNISFDTKLGDYVLEFTNPATLNQFWGEIALLLGEAGIMGEHSSNQGVFTPDPRDAGCAGVGNMSKTYPSFQPPDEFVLLEGLVSAGSQGLDGCSAGLSQSARWFGRGWRRPFAVETANCVSLARAQGDL